MVTSNIWESSLEQQNLDCWTMKRGSGEESSQDRDRDLHRKLGTPNSYLSFLISLQAHFGTLGKNPLFPHLCRGYSNSEIPGLCAVPYLENLARAALFYPLLHPPSLSSRACGPGWSAFLPRVISTKGVFIYLRSSPLITRTPPHYRNA